MDLENPSGLHPYVSYHYPTLNNKDSFLPPTLNKITTESSSGSLYSAYSDGKVLRYDVTTNTLTNILSIYDKLDVLDMEVMGKTSLLTCSHNQVTLFDMIKNKSLSLKGHEESPIAVAAHPISPLVVSVSNLIIQHDLRMRKPININFITPPVYNIQYFADGSYYFLSGEPCRVGREVWVRTLLNGIGRTSQNCKYIALNEMNGNLVVWDWRKSQRVAVVPEVQNEEVYQSVYFSKQNGQTRGLVFLEDSGCLLEHDLVTNRTNKRDILRNTEHENWKLHVDDNETSRFAYVYEHQKSVIHCYQLWHNERQ